jgi:hypothetical protein
MAHDQAEANVVGKTLAKAENESSSDNSGEEEVEVTSTNGDSNPDRVAATWSRVTATWAGKKISESRN